jgi:hypothetical protein
MLSQPGKYRVPDWAVFYERAIAAGAFGAAKPNAIGPLRLATEFGASTTPTVTAQPANRIADV